MDENLIKSTVYITGAGPGDPDLLTIKAKEIIEIADVIAYDNLVSKEVLELALFLNPQVKLLYVGKVVGNPEKTISQEKILKLLLELSKDYKTICRLKGGDPNVFGRGAEEAIFLKENNIGFEFIPGVSSITSVPAYAGIPLTHRDCNSSFTVLTAHEDPEDSESTIKWEDFDPINSTLILLMGTKNLTKIVNKLISLGRKKETPIAIIYQGTTSDQKTYTSTLDEIKDSTEPISFKTPSVIIIGEVVNFRSVLNWFETKKLFGKKVLITRSREQSFSFAKKIIKSGGSPILCPIVSYNLIEKEIFNKGIVNNLPGFNWIIFSSQNAVKYFFEILSKNYLDSRALSSVKIASVGYRTKLELEKYNIKADFTPKRFSFNDLINELSEIENLKDKRILIPTQELSERKFHLENAVIWEIYKANFSNILDESIINSIKSGIDIITLFSSNTVENFSNLIKKYNLEDFIKDSRLAVIGEETANKTKELFGRVDIMANPFTEDGILKSIENDFTKSMGEINV